MKIEFVLGMVGAVTLAGCSSEGDIVPKKDRFARPGFDAGKPPRDPSLNCVKPGTPNNERGVGGYCEQGSDCPDDLGPSFCTGEFAEIGVIDDDKWFCSTLCDEDSECGAGLSCVAGVSGRGCSPFACQADASN
jgi:hypothetical protein